MRFAGYTLPVNPPDAPVRLTKAQLFESLKIKARDPVGYVPQIATCKVLEEHPTGLLREVTMMGKPDAVQERVEFFPLGNVVFNMVDPKTGSKLAVITNTITETPEGELMMTFTFTIGANGPFDTGEDAEQQEKTHAKIALGAMARTLEVTRQLVQEKKIQ